MRQITPILLLIIGCNQEPPKATEQAKATPANGRITVTANSITSPSLVNDEMVTRKFEGMSPIMWAYCLDITNGTPEHKQVLDAFHRTAESNPILLEETAKMQHIHWVLKRPRQKNRPSGPPLNLIGR